MEDKVRGICLEEFSGEPDEIEEITGGVNSKTYRLIYGEESYILQVNSGNLPRQQEHCLRCFQMLTDSKVPVPETFTDEMKEYDSSHYIIVEDLPGETVAEDITPEKMFVSGKYLAFIHEARSFEEPGWIQFKDGEPEVVGFPDDSLKGRIRESMEENLEFFEENNIEWLADITRRFLEDYLELVPSKFQPVLCHLDYNPGNILYQEGDVTGVFDFDYAYSGHAQRDLVKAANNFFVRSEVEREMLYEGYQEVRELDDSWEENKPVYNLETLIDILKSLIEHDKLEAGEAEKYRGELEDIERKIKNRYF